MCCSYKISTIYIYVYIYIYIYKALSKSIDIKFSILFKFKIRSLKFKLSNSAVYRFLPVSQLNNSYNEMIKALLVLRFS